MLARAAALAVALVIAAPAGWAEVCNGCSCKCGPGFRLGTGRCASWDDHWRFTAKGGYPPDAVDELETSDVSPACPKAEIAAKRKRPN